MESLFIFSLVNDKCKVFVGRNVLAINKTCQVKVFLLQTAHLKNLIHKRKNFPNPEKGDFSEYKKIRSLSSCYIKTRRLK